jgi:hypothetical protein
MTPLSDQKTEITFRDILPLFKGRTITGYATGALGDRMDGLTLTFDDETWAQLTLSNPPGIRVDVYAIGGKRIYSDWQSGDVKEIPR